MNEKTRSLMVAIGAGLILDLAGILAVMKFALTNDSTALYLGIGILVIGGVITATRLLAWQRDNAGRQ